MSGQKATWRPIYNRWWFWVLVVFGIVVLVALVSPRDASDDTAGTVSTPSPTQTATPTPTPSPTTEPEPETGCTPLSDAEVAVLVGMDGENWTGDGEFSTTAAEKTAVPAEDRLFTHVVFLQGDAPGLEGEVYVFASQYEDLTQPGGLLVGADSVTREFWVWGESFPAESTPGLAASQSVLEVEECLP